MREQIGRIVATFEASILACLAASCGPPTERRDITVRAVQFPDTIAAASAWDARAYAVIGPSGCWSLESATVHAQHDTVTVSGRAAAQPEGRLCTAMIVQRWLDLTGPALSPGDYILRAGTILDTLTVRAGAGSAALAIVSEGYIGMVDSTWYFSGPEGATYAVRNPEILSGSGAATVRGVLDSTGITLRHVRYE